MPTLTKKMADDIAEMAKQQWKESQTFKQPRMETIKQNENYFLLNITPNLDLPFNDCYPVMYGYVKDMMARIDDPPAVTIGPHNKADFLIAEKINSAFQQELKSKRPGAKWRLKDRWGKKNALFSGRAIYKLWSATPGGRFESNLQVKSHYDFHCEPGGGGDLDFHSYMGEEAIFKTKEDLMIGVKEGVYDKEQVATIITQYNDNDYKDNQDDYDNRNNRSDALGLDVVNNSYVGQTLHKFVEWYLMYRGVKWYCLFEESTGHWIRVKLLEEVIKTNKSPYYSWSTDEDADVFWNLAPCDPVRVLNKATNRFLNQETYNREKQNKGQKAYDADMFLDVEALDDPAVDSLIPAKVQKGKSIAGGLYEFTVPGLGGTINMVEFLNQFIGSKTGQTPGSQGVSDTNKKVGVFFGELDQANELIGTQNKSYTECHEELALAYAQGLYENLDDRGMEVQIMGESGIEWTRLTRYDLKKRGMLDLDIKLDGGSEEEQLKEVERTKKMGGLSRVATVNPQWRDAQILRNSGFSDEEIREAFSNETATSKKLIAQAYEAIEEIELGRKPRINRGANAHFMQTIIDFAEGNDISDALFNKLFDYAMAHVNIAVNNTARDARLAVQRMITQRNMTTINNPDGGGGEPAPVGGPTSPEGRAISIGQQASNELKQ